VSRYDASVGRRSGRPSLGPQSRYDAVLLDAFGTLFMLDQPYERLQASLRSGLAVERTIEQVEAAMLLEIELYADRCHEASDRASLDALELECAALIVRELELEVAPQRALEALAGAIRYTPFDDARPLLDGLRRRGVPSAVVSNWDYALATVLDELGLAADVIVTSAQTGSAKPDPGIFRVALERLGVPPARALHVGDTPGTDAVGAQAAGIDVRIVDRDAPAEGATIASLTAILDLL
jgi:putative hydrolase of the HAD superfamily